MAVGVPKGSSNTGQVRVYQWGGSDWQQLGPDLSGAEAGEYFGFALSLSDDGVRLAVGAYKEQEVQSSSGYVKVFDFQSLPTLAPTINPTSSPPTVPPSAVPTPEPTHTPTSAPTYALLEFSCSALLSNVTSFSVALDVASCAAVEYAFARSMNLSDSNCHVTGSTPIAGESPGLRHSRVLDIASFHRMGRLPGQSMWQSMPHCRSIRTCPIHLNYSTFWLGSWLTREQWCSSAAPRQSGRPARCQCCYLCNHNLVSSYWRRLSSAPAVLRFQH